MGLYLPGCCLSPFLKMGDIFTVFQSRDKIPVDVDRWTTVHSGIALWQAHTAPYGEHRQVNAPYGRQANEVAALHQSLKTVLE